MEQLTDVELEQRINDTDRQLTGLESSPDQPITLVGYTDGLRQHLTELIDEWDRRASLVT